VHLIGTFFQKNEVENIIRELLEVGIIHPSIIPYSSPMVMVLNKEGNWHVFEIFVLPISGSSKKFLILVIDDLLNELHGAKFFTKLDLHSGYHQIRMKEENIPKTNFSPMKAIMSS
jgi:hypothetical protein